MFTIIQNTQLGGITNKEIGKTIYKLAYLKHEDWAYENEWRVHRPHENNDGDYNDWSENPKVFSAIYFGCRINDKDRDDLKKILT